MTSVLLALVWSAVAAIGFAAVARFERRARLVSRVDRPELAPPRAIWGGDPLHPPARALTARALAGFARLVRSHDVVVDHQRGLRALARGVGCSALAVAIALLPLLGTWGGAAGPPLVPLDLRHGLAAVAGLLLIAAFARVAVGLSERSPWSRMAAARQASRQLASMALLTIVLAPLALDAGSLRLHDVVLDQQRPLDPFVRLLGWIGADWTETLRAWPPPAWNVFVQPITALLFGPAIALWVASPRVDDPASGGVGLAGLGLDASPSDLYWIRLDARLSTVLAGGLFVTLFLGGASIPFFEPAALVAMLSPFVGEALPEFGVTILQLGSFVVKLILALAIANRLGGVAAEARDDRSLRLATRRLMPVAWANLLLVAAVMLWLERLQGATTP